MKEGQVNIQERPLPTTGLDVKAGELSLLDLGIIVVTHARKIAIFAAACAIIAAVTSLILPSWYTASVTVLPPREQQSAASSLLGSLGSLAAIGGSDLQLHDPQEVYVAMLRSRAVANALIQKFNLSAVYNKKVPSEVREKLTDHTSISLQKDGTINVQFEDRDRDRAAAIATAYVEQLIAVSGRIATTEAGQKRLFFESKLRETNEKLLTAESELRKLQERSGLIQPVEQGRAIIQSAAILEAQISAKEVEVEQMRSFATPENPALISAQRALSALRQQLVRMKKHDSASNGDVLLATSEVPRAGMDFAQKSRDVKYYQVLFELLGRQLEAARLDESRSGAIIQVLDPAEVPDKRSWPRRGMMVVVGTMLGLFFSTAWYLFMELADRTRGSGPADAAKLQALMSQFGKPRWDFYRDEE